MPELPPARVTREACGTFDGLRAHGREHEELCVVCVAFTDSERVEAERRRPTPPAPIDVRAAVAATARDEGNVVPLRRIS